MIGIEFEARDRTLGDLLSYSKRIYMIPRYQRPYSWNMEQIGDFWEDLLEAFNSGEGFFFGTMIFSPDSDGNTSSIVDGQQRVTTATILYASIRDALLEMDDKSAREKARHIHDNVLFTIMGFGDSRPKLSVQDDVDGYFKDHFQTLDSNVERKVPRGGSTRKMHNAYNFFSKKIGEVTGRFDDERSRDWLWAFSMEISNVEIIEIEVPRPDDAYSIFETVNARGTPLDPADLIKNHIFRKVRPIDGKDSAKHRWDKMRFNLTGFDDDQEKEYSLTKFIRYHWMSKYGFCTQKELYKRIRDEDGLDMNKFLDGLVGDSKIFGELLNSNLSSIRFEQGDYKFRVRGERALLNLNNMRIDQCFVFILSMFRNYESLKLKKPKRPHELLKYLERFNFVYHAVCSRPANRVEKLYSRCATQLEAGCSAGNSRAQRLAVGALVNSLKPLLPNEEIFLEEFGKIAYKRSFKSRSMIRYVLSEFERHHSTGEAEIVREITIEHILPKKPERWGLSMSEISGYVNNIGNLVLLSQHQNSGASNLPLQEKIALLKESSLFMTREAANRIADMNPVVWGRAEIEARNRDLAVRGYDEIWKLK